MRLVFSGPPGAGKGTQAEALSQSAGLAHLATGDMFRAAVAAGTPLGEKARKIMASGALMPDSVVMDIIRSPIEENLGRGFILDGFPRTMPQAKALDAMLEAMGSALDGVISLTVDEEQVRARMRNRLKAAGEAAREDDREDVFTTRMAAYWEHARPLMDYYQEQGRLIPVSAEGSIAEVGEAILRALGEKNLVFQGEKKV